MAVRGDSASTVGTRAAVLRLFIEWCDERSVTTPQAVTRPLLERYQRHLHHYRKPNGKPLGLSTQAMRLNAVQLWFRHLVKRGQLHANPASDLELPSAKLRAPVAVLSVAEVEKLLAVPQLGTLLGLRDRALLETLYSTAMRRKEVAALKRSEVDFERGTVVVREGKGGTSRLIPIGERALAWLNRYLDEVRGQLVAGADDGTVFLTEIGGRFELDTLSRLVGEYVKASGLRERGSCHLLRHAAATHMLEAGADIRFIQAMLGHALLSTTQLYTHVAVAQLKAVHSATHPSARLRRTGTTTALEGGAVNARAALLEELRAEAAAEE
jgi:integrase/recombinase XerD